MPDWADMGGRSEFFGPVAHAPAEPVFHEPWEGRVFGMTLFVASAIVPPNIDAARYAMERLPRDVYMSSYYRRWLGGLETKLQDAGYLAPGEVDARLEGTHVAGTGKGMSRTRVTTTARVLRWMLQPRLSPWICAHVLPRMIGTSRPALSRPRFSVGDRIRVRAERAPGHTRQPGYVSGKPGVVTARLTAALLPDAHAVGRRARPQHLYTVAFEGQDLWGDAAEPDTEVRVDMFEPYLEAA